MTPDLIKFFEYRYVKPFLGNLKPWQKVDYNGIGVSYKKILNGGGTTIGQDYIAMLQERGLPKQLRIFEWCSGPGFIGFSMLARGLCDTLCLADVNPRAVEACRRTVRQNRLEDRVSVYHSNNLKDIPESERWDLIVSNPPHYEDFLIGDIRGQDKGWNIHRGFLGDIGKFLKPGGVIALLENNQGSTVATFQQMIDDAGMRVVFTHDHRPELTPQSHNYTVGIMRRGDPVPAWASFSK
jgi:16S rRNA G966 N2-methylase RsmD